MATYVNTAPSDNGSNGTGFFLGLVLLIIAALLFFVYGLPLVSRGMGSSQVNVPGSVNVHMQK